MGATTCNMAKFLSAIGLLFVAALALAAPTPTQNIVQLAAGIPDLSTLVTALEAGKLTTALSGNGPFTVFAPTNEAFAALPPATLASLLSPANIKQLDAILEYHVIAGAAVRAEDLKASQNVKTLEGQEVHINKISGSVTVQNAKVIQADVGATNGVVHVISGVLSPPTAVGSSVASGVFTFYTADGPDCAGAVVAKTGKISSDPNVGGSCGISVQGIGGMYSDKGPTPVVEALGCDTCGNLISFRYGGHGRPSDPAHLKIYMSQCESGITSDEVVRLLSPPDQNVCNVDPFNRTVYTKAVWACPYPTNPCN